MSTACYLDIETTGLSARHCRPSVVGLLVADEFFQWHGEGITRENILESLPEDSVIYTYNGHRFDLPFLDHHLQINFQQRFKTVDLMFDCWRCGLKGGLKVVQNKLGFGRQDTQTDGYMAVILWNRWVRDGDQEALDRLLSYNREDVQVLPLLRKSLGLRLQAAGLH